MNYNQIGILLLQGTLVSFVILLLFRLRKQLGMGSLFACLGLFQFVQVFLSSTVYVSITDNLIISPGSSVLFTSTLFALLIIYIKEDASETKKIIYALFIANIVMSILFQLFGWNLEEETTYNPYNVSTKLFNNNGWVLFVGTVVLFLDSLLIIMLFELIAKRVRFLFLQICFTMLIVVSFDTVFFSMIAFWSFDNLKSILTSGLIAKGSFALFYSLLFYVYLKFFELNNTVSSFFKIKDVFVPLTYKQKFESAEEDIKKAKEKREIELIASNKEKEKRIEELEVTKQKIQESLELLEKRDYSLNESSRIAKIGHWEYNIANDAFIWSAYIYQIYGLGIDDKIPSRKEMITFYDKESQKKLAQATLDLNEKGTPYDIELKLTNLNNEEVWVRQVVQSIYNQENKIIGRRGVVHNITDFKQTQLELEFSKQEIKDSLELLKSKEAHLQEISSMAKIGYWGYSNENFNIIWSEYHYRIFGLDPKEGIPPREVLLSFFDKKSREMIEKCNLDLVSKGISYDIEVKLINKRKEEVWVRNVVQPLYNKENKVVGRRGLLQDITESKNAQLKLELSKQKIQKSLEQLAKSEHSMSEASKVAEMGYWERDSINDKLKWSEYIYHIFGVDPKKEIPSEEEIFKIFDKESQEKLKQATLNLSNKGVPYDIELKLVNLKKEEVWVRSVVQPINNQYNKIIGRRGIIQNITASKKAQLQIEFSNKKVQNTLDLLEKRKSSMDEASKIGKIGFWEVDLVHKTVVWSDYVHKIFGSNPKDKIPSQREIREKLTDKSREKLIKETKNLTSKGIPYDIELKLINLRKEEVWVRNVAQPIFNKENKIIGRRGVLQNITDFKKAQIELEFSKQKIQESLELLERRKYSMDEASKVAKIGYWEHDIENDSIIWSDYVHHIFGSDPKKEIPSQSEIVRNFSDKSQEKFSEATLNLISKGIPYDIELKYNNPKEGELWIRNVAQPIYNLQNKIIGKRGILQNITDQKIKQKELDKKNDQLYELNNALNLAQKLSQVGSWQWNIKTDEAEWSDEMYNIYGVTKESFYPSNKNVMKTVVPEDLPKIEKGVSSLLVDKMFVPFEFRIKRPSGEIRNLYIMALEKNSGDSIFGVTKDITNRKRIEEKTLILKEEYRELFDNATISIWNEDLTLVFKQVEELRKLKISNIKKYLEEHPKLVALLLANVKVNSVNNATLKLFKAKSIRFFTDNIQNSFGKGANKVFINLIESIWNNEKIFTSEVNYKRQDGEEFAALLSIPIPKTKRKQKTIPVSIQSIQNIKNAESEKRESLRKLKEAQALAHVGNWGFNLLTQKSEWSEETFRIWGFDVNKFAPDGDTILNRIHADDHKMFNQAAELAYSQGKPYDIEFRICLPNNIEKTIRSICLPIFDDQGKVVKLKGTNQDITAQKRILHKIEKAEEMYRLLADNSNDLICLHETDSTFKYISPSIKTILGYNPSEKIGKKGFSLIYKDDVVFFRKSIEQRIFKKVPNNTFFCRAIHKKGHLIWLEFSTSAVFKNNKPDYILTSARDVTQWMVAKKEIQEYQTSLQKLTAEISLIEEKQKKEIATNIHDHLSQFLVISKMRVNALKKNPQLKMIDEDLKFIETHISEALENSRKITYELSPPVLYQLGIIEALSWLLDDIEETHKIKSNIISNVTSIKLSDVKSILLYRSIQEVITNTIKYAKASVITLNIKKNKKGLYILVTDNGVGFDTSILSNHHHNNNQLGSGFGLFTVKERIRNIKGDFSIVSEINKGTTVKFFIPLSL